MVQTVAQCVAQNVAQGSSNYLQAAQGGSWYISDLVAQSGSI